MLEIDEYINQKNDLNTLLLEYIDKEGDDDDEDNQELFENINNEKIMENSEQLKNFIKVLSIIAKNHHRNPHFFDRIEQIFQKYKEEIKQTFSNEELFNIFKKNKRILLFLFKEKIIIVNKWIFNFFNSRRFDKKFKNFFYYFYPELKEFIEKEEDIKKIEEELTKINTNIFNDFEEKRLKGENDSYISYLIRNDSAEDFISYVSRTNFSLTNQVESSIFETNSFLLKNESTLIEYAAFYGSIQIFKYLLLNNVELTPSLWIYAIHSKSSELIHLLEFNHVKVEDGLFIQCLKESIKCHHNDIANYILNVLLDENNGFDNEYDFGFHYHNYSFFPENFIDNNLIVFYICKYNYLDIVKILLSSGFEIDFKTGVVL